MAHPAQFDCACTHPTHPHASSAPARQHLRVQKAPGIIGRAAETDAQRVQRLYDTLQDFGENDLVLG